MRVGLLYPEVYDMARFREQRKEFPPFGVLYLAASLRQANHASRGDVGFAAAPASSWTSGVNYLAHEDAALKAYHESRSRYLGALQPRLAFNQIGEVMPTIYWMGKRLGYGVGITFNGLSCTGTSHKPE